MERTMIGIMVDGKSSRSTTLKLYERHNQLPIRLIAFSADDIMLNKMAVRGLYQEGKLLKEKVFPFPCVVYNRSFHKHDKIAQVMQVLLGENKFFNVMTRLNKWEVYNLLYQTNLKQYIPNTLLFHREQILKQLDLYHQIYVKPIYGSQGNKVYRLARNEAGDVVISLHTHYPSYTLKKNDAVKKMEQLIGRKTYIIQQGIKFQQLQDSNFDIRALVQKNIEGKWTVTVITSRIAYSHCFNTSLCTAVYNSSELLTKLYSEKQRDEILQTIHYVSIQAAQEIEYKYGLMGELSVDFALDQESKLWIIEVNGKPQKSIYTGVKGLKHKHYLYQNPLGFAYYLSQ
ncbi:YheC/YheD family protein [Paenibacillus sp. LPE1-1-1.1]|uniref:YheC/YheD family protein n=1 Tax=Paenibacillus sp. LPE1-1-1.1 TaxID=3135230 RepID=UPI003439961F